MTKLYTDFLQEVLPYVRDCPYDVATNAVRNSVIDFCEQTQWITDEPDPQTLLANVDTYDIEYDKGLVPIRLLWVKVNGVLAAARMTNDYSVVLAQTPNVRSFSGLTMKIALRPSRDSTGVEDSVYQRWLEGIAHGARSRLYQIPAQPFSDPQRAIVEAVQFKSAVADARAEVQRDGTTGPIHVRHPRSW